MVRMLQKSYAHMKADTVEAVKEFEARTGLNPSKARQGSGSMKDYLTFTIEEKGIGDKLSVRNPTTENGRVVYLYAVLSLGGIKITFRDRVIRKNGSWGEWDADSIRITIHKTEFKNVRWL